MKEITVKITYEFYFDAEGLDERFVDINGLAIEYAKLEMKDFLDDLTYEDFTYSIDDKTEA